MKRKYYILGLLATLCLLGTGYYAWTLYDAHRKQVAEWNEGAKAAFEEALWVEVNKRAKVPFYHVSSGEKGIITLDAKIPDSVYVTTSMGRKAYRLERFKYDNSLTKERDKSVKIGVLILEYPLSLDTIKSNWDSLLIDKQIVCQSKMRYVYTDLVEQNDTIKTWDGRDNFFSDSLTVKYLGFRCEHEITAYISYPYWMSCLTNLQYVILSLPLLLWLLLSTFYSGMEAFVRHKLVREKIVVQKEQIHIVDVQIDTAKVFKLPDGTLFDSFAKVLSKGGIQHNIQPQSVSLLRLFLSKDDLKVTSEEISWELWQEKREKDRLYSAVRRLRNDLKAIKSDLVISCTDGVYELKSPISSNISDQN